MTKTNQKILICSPDYFGVDYVINPWMESNRGKTDPIRAKAQWQALHDLLAQSSIVVTINPQQSLPDMVFTANAGLVLNNLAVVSRFRSTERQGEEPHFRAWFEGNGFKIAPWPMNVYFEGAGDALLDRGQPILWCGFGFRSDQGALSLLQQLMPERRVIGLRLVDPRFYHLDTCFCPLSRGYLIYYPHAFNQESQKLIEANVPKDKRIEVSEDDAVAFACNAVDLDPIIVLNEATSHLSEKLATAGFTVVRTPMSEFLKSGGAAKCLTLKLHEDR